MKSLADKSTLRSKLILVIMLCCTIALLLNNLFIFSLGTADFKKNKVIRLFILADILANNSTAALTFSDKETAKEILHSSIADTSISHAILFDHQCQLFEEYKSSIEINNRTSAIVAHCIGTRYASYQEDHLYLSIPVILKKEQIGTLYLKSGLNDLNKMLSRQIQVFSILFLVTLLIAFLLTYKLQMLFLTPIKKLLSAIRYITQHNDYSIHVQSHTNDELALLANEFNGMIAKIHQHDQQLNTQNLLLEKTVDQRTQELRTNIKQLKQAKESAEIASQAKSDFLSHMSHDLRTPLNSLLGYVQILQRKMDFPTKYRNEIKIIGQSSEYLLSLINDLLDLTKIESNKLELLPHTFNTNDFLNPLVELFSQLATEKKLPFAYQIEGSLPVALYGDENRLRRILSNLLENAIKFTKKGKISFRVSYKDNRIYFTVKDSGCGIDKQNLQMVFKSFHQISHSSDNDGLGLGLYITQYLVELMQGELLINSKLNKGTTCLLSLPLPAKQYTPPTPDKYRTVTGFAGNIKTILVTDDKMHNTDVLQSMLQPLGFNIVLVNSGLACLNVLQQQPIDMVLLDIVMPVLNGIETCKRIHQLNLADKPKIVMITANAFIEDREKSLAAGCDDFIAKPVILNQLLDVIEQQLNLQWTYQQTVKQTAEENTFNPQSLRLLIAEDDEICRLLINQNLTELDVTATFVVDGKAAIEKITLSTFDCIILDNKMPYKSGVEIANHIRHQVTQNAQSYLILMSALTTDDTRKAAMQAGFDDVLSKPLDIEKLNQVLFATYQRSLR